MISDAPFERIQGHVLDVLRTMPDESVNCCVTSPPYLGLRDYNIPPQVWGGNGEHSHVWGAALSLSTDANTDKRRWNHAQNGRGEEQPVEKQIDREIVEVDQGAFCECGAWRGSLGLEPNPDLYVEHIVEVFREVRRVLRSDGTLWLNIGDSYASGGCGARDANRWPKQSRNDHMATHRKKNTGMKPKDLMGMPWLVAFALRADGWWLRQDIIWHKTNPMPESVVDRCTKAHEYVFLLSKSARYYFNADAIAEPASLNTHPRRPAAGWHQGTRAEGNAPRDKRRRKLAEAGGGIKNNSSFDAAMAIMPDMRNKRSVWTIPTEPTPEAHFATYPIALAEVCILAGCPPGGVTVDPFSGSGTTGLAAVKHGRTYKGIELNPEYIGISDARAERHMPLLATGAL